jgi:hypothetical protein
MFASKNTKRWFSLVPLKYYVAKNSIETNKLVEAELVYAPIPKVFPPSGESYFYPLDTSYIFPEIYVAGIREAMVFGGTNLVSTNGLIICHDLYDFEKDYTSEELHGRHLINAKKKQIPLADRSPAPDRCILRCEKIRKCSAYS